MPRSPGASESRGNPAFGRRADLERGLAAVRACEAPVAANLAQPGIPLRLSRTLYLLGDGPHRFREEGDKQLDALMRGARHAAAAVALTAPRFRPLLCSGRPVPEAIASHDARGTPAICWFATNPGKYGLAENLIELLDNKDMIFGVMNAARRLRPTCLHHAPDRYGTDQNCGLCSTPFNRRGSWDPPEAELARQGANAPYAVGNFRKTTLFPRWGPCCGPREKTAGTGQTTVELCGRSHRYPGPCYTGACYTKIPFPAGDPAKALRHFRASMRGARDDFATCGLVAEMYVLKVKDRVPDDARYCRLESPRAEAPTGDLCRRLFRRPLEHTIRTSARGLPKIEAERRVEPRKARSMVTVHLGGAALGEGSREAATGRSVRW